MARSPTAATSDLHTFKAGSRVRVTSVPFGQALMVNDLGVVALIVVICGTTFATVEWDRIKYETTVRAERLVRYD